MNLTKNSHHLKQKVTTDPAAKPIVNDPNAAYQGCTAHGVFGCRLCCAPADLLH